MKGTGPRSAPAPQQRGFPLRSLLLNLLLIAALLAAVAATFVHRTLRATLPPEPPSLLWRRGSLDVITGRRLPPEAQRVRHLLFALMALSLALLVAALVFGTVTREPLPETAAAFGRDGARPDAS